MAEFKIRIQNRKDTTANWTSQNPVLLSGEIGYDETEGKFKVGDGVTAWNSLPFFGTGGGGGGGPVSWNDLTGDQSVVDLSGFNNDLAIPADTDELSEGGSNLYYTDARVKTYIESINEANTVIYVSPIGDDANDGLQPWAAKATIKDAVENAPDGAAVFLAPGEYVEEFPITFPDEVSMVGRSYYNTTIKPASGFETNTCFLVNNGNFLTNFTLRDIENWAVEFAANAFITRSPYVFNASVVTTSANAGVMHADGSVPNASSPFKSMLNSQFTPVMNGSKGYLVQNGAFMQCVSAFSLFNDYGFKALSGGIMRLDNCGCQFGNFGLIADGAGSQIRAGIVSFDEVGAGTAFSDIGNGRVEANYVTETNGGKVYRGIIDEVGDFSIGDLFKVEQATGEVTVNTSAFNFSSTSSIVVAGITLGSSSPISEFSVDGTLAGNSNNVVPTEQAVKTYVDNITITESQISDLQNYLTAEVNDLTAAVTWDDIPDANVPESAVTQHQAALSITESQISDLQNYLTAEVNDLTAAVTWADIPDTNVPESAVTQHEGALTITESQVSDLGNYALASHTHLLADITDLADTDDLTEGSTNLYHTDARAVSAIQADSSWNAGNWDIAYGWGDHSAAGYLTSESNDLTAAVTWADIPDANVPESAVTQHEAALTLTEGQISDLGSYLTAETNDLTAAVTWADIPDANVPESAVTQHETALTITESQISDLQNYLVSGSTSLDDLTDVDTSTTAPTADQALIWDDVSSKFVPGDVASGASYPEFVASGSIPGAGTSVALKADGTVEVVENAAVSAGAGTAEVFESAAVDDVSATFDSTNGKVVVAYQDEGNSDHGTAVVGTVSGTSISFGTPVVFESGETNFISATFDSTNDKIVIAYRDKGNSNYGTAIVGTVSGTSISFGTAVVFESADVQYISVAFDSTNDKVVIAYQDRGNSNKSTAIVGTVSGTGISFGTSVVFDNDYMIDSSTTFDSTNNKVVIAYKSGGNSNYGTAIVGTVSGTSISFGTPVVFESASTSDISATFDSTNDKVVIAYRDFGNSNHGTAVVGTVSGTSISFGTPVVFESASTNDISATFDSTNDKVVIAYRDFGNSNHGTAVVGTVSGTSISFGTPVVFESASTNDISATFDSTNDKAVIAYRDNGNSDHGTAVVYTTTAGTNTNAADFIGFAQDSASDTDNVPVAISSLIDENQSGLTVGEDYYVDKDGNLTTTPTDFPIAGKALSATSLQVDGSIPPPEPSLFPEFVASGSIPGAGTSVALKADGTVEVIEADTVSAGAGTAEVFESAETNYIFAVFDSANDKIVIAYQDGGNSDHGTAVVGTVSGTSISFGTPVVFESATTRFISATFDNTNDKIVIAYEDEGNSGKGTAIVGTVSGTSISFGTPVVFESGETRNTSAIFDSTNDKVVIAYKDNDNSGHGTAIVGTVSGTSISFGTAVVFESASTSGISAAFDSTNDKVVIAYEDIGNSKHGTAVVGTVSGTSISFGTPVVFESAETDEFSVVFDSTNDKVVIAYQDEANSNRPTAIVGTVSGTSISFGGPVIIASVVAADISATFDSANDKVVIAYRDVDNSQYGTAVVGTVSGTSISFDTPVVFESAITTLNFVTFDSTNDKAVIAYQDGGNSNYGTAVVYRSVSTIESNAGGFIGFAQDSAADTENVPVAIFSYIDENQSSLTPNTVYYVDSDGTVSDSDTGYPKVGRAIAADKIQVGNT